MRLVRRFAWLSILGVLGACSGSVRSGRTTSPAVPGETCGPDGSTATAQDGCNSCTCSEGLWACTEMTCCQGNLPDDGCNSCSCVDRQWVCTARACPAQCPPPAEPPPNVRCAPVPVFAKDAASGLCCDYESSCFAPSGWDLFTSQAACTGQGECTPGETKAVECNTCTCAGDGSGWICTRMACRCTAGETRRAPDGCNVCTCNDDGTWGGCTERGCDGTPIGCGGWLGLTCTDDEYCAYEVGQYCGAADASAICRQRPDACDSVYEPVCGCDGQGYSNACEAAMAGTGVHSAGQCPMR